MEKKNTWRNGSANAVASREDRLTDVSALEITSDIMSIHPSSIRDLGGSRVTEGNARTKSCPSLRRLSEPRETKSTGSPEH